jgi:hypothetical protein
MDSGYGFTKSTLAVGDEAISERNVDLSSLFLLLKAL